MALAGDIIGTTLSRLLAKAAQGYFAGKMQKQQQEKALDKEQMKSAYDFYTKVTQSDKYSPDQRQQAYKQMQTMNPYLQDMPTGIDSPTQKEKTGLERIQDVLTSQPLDVKQFPATLAEYPETGQVPVERTIPALTPEEKKLGVYNIAMEEKIPFNRVKEYLGLFDLEPAKDLSPTEYSKLSWIWQRTDDKGHDYLKKQYGDIFGKTTEPATAKQKRGVSITLKSKERIKQMVKELDFYRGKQRKGKPLEDVEWDRMDNLRNWIDTLSSGQFLNKKIMKKWREYRPAAHPQSSSAWNEIIKGMKDAKPEEPTTKDPFEQYMEQ